jgi:hypothetical protein
MRRFPRLPFVLALCALFTSCKGEPAPPRPASLITDERRSLPALYITEKTGQERILPGNTDILVDEETGEICYRAYACTRDDCPGKDKRPDGRPFLFIHIDPTLEAMPDGTVNHRKVNSAAEYERLVKQYGNFLLPTCTECAKTRNLKTESKEVKQEYMLSVKPYVLPETAERMKELDEEHRARIEYMKERRNRVPENLER